MMGKQHGIVLFSDSRTPISVVCIETLCIGTSLCAEAVVLLLLIYCLIYFPLFVGVLCLSLVWYSLLCVLYSFAIILKGKRDLDALILLSYGSLVTANVPWLFLAVPWVGLLYVIAVFPDHTHLLYNQNVYRTSVKSTHFA